MKIERPKGIVARYLLLVQLCIAHGSDRAWENVEESRLEATASPNYVFCKQTDWKWCDVTLSLQERTDAFVDALSMEEKISLLSPDPALGNTCDTHSSAVPRLGFSGYMWLTEANTDVAGACFDDMCRTTFVGPLGCAASFNRSSWLLKGRVLSTEARAMRNIGLFRAVGATEKEQAQEKIGITLFGPNINIMRDPRFGRNSELAGEDPFLAGVYGGYMVRGMQETDSNGRIRSLAFLKHYTAYSVETNRFQNDHDISPFDLFDSYLRQFELASRIGKPAGVMCSYNGVNGHPMCANGKLLDGTLRSSFQIPEAIVTSDCGAIDNLKFRSWASNITLQASMAINNGTDLEMGSTVFRDPSGLPLAVRIGLVQETTIDKSVWRLVYGLMKAGLFDPFGASEFDSLNKVHINSKAHQAIQQEAALQAPVLLRNDDSVLPIQQGSKLAVVGPFANNAEGLFSDYMSLPPCPGVPGNVDCVITISRAIQELNQQGKTLLATDGINELSGTEQELENELRIAREAHFIILALGSSKLQEKETVDKTMITLPQIQATLYKRILALQKPTIVLLVNGGQLAVDNLASHPSRQGAPLAIVEAFNPNRDGSRAIASLLFGQQNRWGKLPYTIYPASVSQQLDLLNFDMRKPPGRTYRYFTGTPLWPFGFGLSYTTFALTGCSCGEKSIERHKKIQLNCSVQNTGSRYGEEVIQVYQYHHQTQKTLIQFDRVGLAPGQTKPVAFQFESAQEAFAITDENGQRVTRRGDHQLEVTLGTLGGSAARTGSVTCSYVLL